jgi:hypothetical protein
MATAAISRKGGYVPVTTGIPTLTTELPAVLSSELQRVLSVGCYASLPTTSMKKADQEKHLFDTCHGQPGTVSFISQLIDGRGLFSNVHDNTLGANGAKQLQDLLLADGGPVCFGPGPLAINKEVLMFSNLPKAGKTNTLLSGRTIINYALSCAASFKMFVNAGKKFLNKDGTLRSGTTVKDYLDYVRGCAWDEMKGQDGDEDKENGDNGYEQGKGMPPGWFPKGFYTLVLYGPFGKDCDRMDWLKHGTFIPFALLLCLAR